MKDDYRYILDTLALSWIVTCNNPLTIRLRLHNRSEIIIMDMGSHWRVSCYGKTFTVKVRGSFGLRLAIMQAAALSEEIECMTDRLMEAGYRKMNPSHSEWIIFESPDYHWATISPMGENSDPRGEWGVYSPDDSVKRFVRAACEAVRGVDNVI